MKNKIYNFLSKPYIVLLTMLIAPLFGLIDRNFVFFFGLGVALTLLWSGNFNWSKFGLGQKISGNTVLTSLLLSLAYFTAFSVIDPILQHYLGDFDLSSLEDIKGNLEGYIVIMVVMWIFAAFGEEFLFRGYYMKALAELFGNSDKAWLISAVFTSVYFGLSHAYQGLAGVVSVFIWSLSISFLFSKMRNNLILLMLIHGFTDSIGLTLMYLNKESIISIWIQQLIQ